MPPTTPPPYPVEKICSLLRIPSAYRPFLNQHWKPILQLAASLAIFAWTIPPSLRLFHKGAAPVALSLLSIFGLRIIYEVMRHKNHRSATPQHPIDKDASS